MEEPLDMVAAIGLNIVCDVEVEGVDLGAEEVSLEEVVRVKGVEEEVPL